MIYILMIWTTIAIGGGSPTFNGNVAKDWRPIGEFHGDSNTALEKCEAAARQLGWTSDQHQKYRCVRSK